MISIDTETFLFTREEPIPRFVCMSLCSVSEAEIVVGRQAYFVAEGLLSGSEPIVGCNIAFDLAVLAREWPDLERLIWNKYRRREITDVAIRQQLWDISVGRTRGEDTPNYSLGYLSELLFDEKLPGKRTVRGVDPWRLRYHELIDIPVADWPKAAVDYAKGDARVTYRVWRAQEEIANDIPEHWFFAESAFALHLTALGGMQTEPGKVAAFRTEYAGIMHGLENELVSEGLFVRTRKGLVKSTHAAQLRVERGHRGRNMETPQTEGGQVAIDKAACLNSGDPVLLKRLEYVRAEKMLHTYYPILQNGTTGPITTRFKLAATGRTTSSDPGPPMKGGNFQVAPRDGGYRECFVPKPGNVFLAADFSGAELHTLAQICRYRVGWTKLGDALNEGLDLHIKVAAMLLEIEYEDALVQHKQGDPDVINARQDAKAANFGFPGGMRERAFIRSQLEQRGRVWAYEDARRLRNAWLRAFPEMTEYQEKCSAEIGPKEEAVIEVPGTKFRRLVSSMNMCCNTYFQVLAAFGARAALTAVVRKTRLDNSCNAEVVNFVHDEIILEVVDDPSRSCELAYEVSHIMEDKFNKYVPDYPVKAEPVLMRYWSKSAVPTFDDGRLVPWNG